jgi:hypothetical protein
MTAPWRGLTFTSIWTKAGLKERIMKNRSYAVGWLFLALTSLGWGQSPPCANNWCGPYYPTSYSQTNHSAFFSTPPVASTQNSWGMTAHDINTFYNAYKARPDIVPNGAVGKYQYLEYADKYVQAYDRATGYPILSSSMQGSPGPQGANSPWEPHLGSGKCGPGSIDVVSSYDHANSVWVLAGTSNVTANGQNTDSYVCVAVSIGEDLLNVSGGYQSFWNGYAFDLGLDVNGGILPTHLVNGQPVPDIADYGRFGAWNGYYYVTFDLINLNATSYGLEGFVVCQFTQSQMLAGNSPAPAPCYRYLTSTPPTLIHTLLPADAESNSFPSGTAGEYFLATVNPDNGSGGPCTQLPCNSTHLAFWTWSDISNEQAATMVTVNSFSPGCYHTNNVAQTTCVPEKDSTTVVDGVGDRLMSRLAYRNLPLICNTPRSPCGEILAVTQTIAVDPSNPTGQTQVRYYTLVSLNQLVPTVEYQGQLVDSSLFYFMPSNAIDKNGVVGYTFTGSNATTYPRLYVDTLGAAGVQGVATVVPGLSFTGSENGNPNDNNQFWGEYVSTTIDPTDDLEFWSTGGFYPADQINCTSTANPVWNGCSWYTGIFSCKKGDSNCP